MHWLRLSVEISGLLWSYAQLLHILRLIFVEVFLFERLCRKNNSSILKARQSDINYRLIATSSEMQPFAKCDITLQVIHQVQVIHHHYTDFFGSFQTYATFSPGFLLYLMLMSKRKKDLGDDFGPYAFIQDLCWPLMQGSRVLFQTWIICKVGALILFKINMAEKDVHCAHTYCSLDCNFSFCMDFLHHW